MRARRTRRRAPAPLATPRLAAAPRSHAPVRRRAFVCPSPFLEGSQRAAPFVAAPFLAAPFLAASFVAAPFLAALRQSATPTRTARPPVRRPALPAPRAARAMPARRDAPAPLASRALAAAAPSSAPVRALPPRFSGTACHLLTWIGLFVSVACNAGSFSASGTTCSSTDLATLGQPWTQSHPF